LGVGLVEGEGPAHRLAALVLEDRRDVRAPVADAEVAAEEVVDEARRVRNGLRQQEAAGGGEVERILREPRLAGVQERRADGTRAGEAEVVVVDRERARHLVRVDRAGARVHDRRRDEVELPVARRVVQKDGRQGRLGVEDVLPGADDDERVRGRREAVLGVGRRRDVKEAVGAGEQAVGAAEVGAHGDEVLVRVLRHARPVGAGPQGAGKDGGGRGAGLVGLQLALDEHAVGIVLV
jgi:hypothetical protein